MVCDHLLIFAVFFIAQTSASALHGACKVNSDCGTIDTYCKNDTCVCKPNFLVWFDTCLQRGTPRIKCKKKHDCFRSLGQRSICMKEECVCRDFHHLHLGQCVKNRNLYDICEHDHQCYCGEGCENKIACIANNCTCKPGNEPYRSRLCIDKQMEETSSGTTRLIAGSFIKIFAILFSVKLLYYFS